MLSRMQQRNKNIFLVQVLVSSFSCLFHCVSTFDGVICCQIARTKDPLAHDLLGENEKQQRRKHPYWYFIFILDTLHHVSFYTRRSTTATIDIIL